MGGSWPSWPSWPSSDWNDIHQGTSAGSDSFVRAPWSCPGVLASRTEESCAIVPRNLDGIWWTSMEVLWNYGIPENTRILWYSMLKDTCILLNSHDFWRFSWISMNSQESSWILMAFHEFWSNTTIKKNGFKSLHVWITTRLQVARLVLGIQGCQLCTSTVGFLMEMSGLQCGSIGKIGKVYVYYIYISYIHVM